MESADKQFCKAYLEITNVCNLHCLFCPNTARTPAFMAPEQFDRAAEQIKEFTDYIYLHLMGEPLLHPALEEILAICAARELRVNLITNGTLLSQTKKQLLCAPALRKVGISLHSIESNRWKLPWLDGYLNAVFDFARAATAQGILCELRLWNADSKRQNADNGYNAHILRRAQTAFGPSVMQPPNERGSVTIAPQLFLSYAQVFEWPGAQTAEKQTDLFCHALRDQIGVLCDGTVVPCCLDSEGTLALGNIWNEPLVKILAGERAQKIYEGFSRREAVEPLCQSCGYARRFGGKGR